MSRAGASVLMERGHGKSIDRWCLIRVSATHALIVAVAVALLLCGGIVVILVWHAGLLHS